MPPAGGQIVDALPPLAVVNLIFLPPPPVGIPVTPGVSRSPLDRQRPRPPDFILPKHRDHHGPDRHARAAPLPVVTLCQRPKIRPVRNQTVYITPLPHYLPSHSFWEQNLAPGSEHRGKALGFVRSYERLILYPSDFVLAKEAQLIPSSRSPPSFQLGQQP